jgi:hypothetical protein
VRVCSARPARAASPAGFSATRSTHVRSLDDLVGSRALAVILDEVIAAPAVALTAVEAVAVVIAVGAAGMYAVLAPSDALVPVEDDCPRASGLRSGQARLSRGFGHRGGSGGQGQCCEQPHGACPAGHVALDLPLDAVRASVHYAAMRPRRHFAANRVLRPRWVGSGVARELLGARRLPRPSSRKKPQKSHPASPGARLSRR